MNSFEVRKLRLRQMISTNLYIIVVLSLFTAAIVELQPTRLQALSAVVTFIATICFLNWLEFKGIDLRPFSWAKRLVSYEKEKLGPEWYKHKSSELYSRAILIPLLSLQLLFDNRNEPFLPNGLDPFYWLTLAVAIILVVNLHLFFRNRKIDRLSTAELQGYTKKEFGISLVMGLVMFFVVASFIIFFLTL
ncbi:hypothetical protein DS745_20800 [Anaerobacillus alkaliphilus]|uniref:Uncharacterized protein n=1 Tax=Anaerobacillus alkaliphilus TaxID=1548597 RepID=A0A4Q0VMA0_9BACI|nr:hypothetical protein [Anaerobacillus alkaliphilus]RXI96184.1 hypothetical protein DS745_20800 [Anaerobacillus alkaliphilus]